MHYHYIQICVWYIAPHRPFRGAQAIWQDFRWGGEEMLRVNPSLADWGNDGLADLRILKEMSDVMLLSNAFEWSWSKNNFLTKNYNRLFTSWILIYRLLVTTFMCFFFSMFWGGCGRLPFFYWQVEPVWAMSKTQGRWPRSVALKGMCRKSEYISWSNNIHNSRQV